MAGFSRDLSWFSSHTESAPVGAPRRVYAIQPVNECSRLANVINACGLGRSKLSNYTVVEKRFRGETRL